MMIPPPAEVAAKVIARDSRRVKWLTGMTVLLWVLAVAAIVFLVATYDSAITPKQRLIFDTERKLNTSEVRADPAEEEKLERKLYRNNAIVSVAMWMGTAALAVTVGVLALASLGTVLLVFATRRATLRQIQASLAEISAQLADLRQRTTAGPTS